MADLRDAGSIVTLIREIPIVSNTSTIADYVAGADSRTLPIEVLDKARLCLADWLGVAIGGRQEAAAVVVHAVASRWASHGRSTLLIGGKAAAPIAALCNGTLAHSLDFDDTYVNANTHTSAPLWSATLALGEEVRASEEDMLRAFVGGFETAARTGSGLGEAVTARGWHATGAFGRIGAAAASSVLLHLDTNAARNALGAAATQVSGLVASFGTMAKPFHAGKAAIDGVLSAQLAAEGFQACGTLLDAGAGLDTALIQDRSLSITPADFSRWEILNNSFKPYAACHLTHPLVDAARALQISRSRLADIRAIRAQVGQLAAKVTGGGTGKPKNGLEAKFDIKHCVALALHGYSLSANDFSDAVEFDPAVAKTAVKVVVEESAEFGYRSAGIEVVFQSGEAVRFAVQVAKGHPENPMSWTDMWKKFEVLVVPVAGERTEELFEHIRNFGMGSGNLVTMMGELSDRRALAHSI
jgi:2-methylcitrate dehydratase PrpD